MRTLRHPASEGWLMISEGYAPPIFRSELEIRANAAARPTYGHDSRSGRDQTGVEASALASRTRAAVDYRACGVHQEGRLAERWWRGHCRARCASVGAPDFPSEAASRR